MREWKPKLKRNLYLYYQQPYPVINIDNKYFYVKFQYLIIIDNIVERFTITFNKLRKWIQHF